MTNAAIEAAFEHIADLLEYRGDNLFRVRAYRNAARTIGGLVESLASVRSDPDRQLTDLEGIGTDLAGKIDSLLDTGRLPLLEELERQVPEDAFSEARRVLTAHPGASPVCFQVGQENGEPAPKLLSLRRELLSPSSS